MTVARISRCARFHELVFCFLTSIHCIWRVCLCTPLRRLCPISFCLVLGCGVGEMWLNDIIPRVRILWLIQSRSIDFISQELCYGRMHVCELIADSNFGFLKLRVSHHWRCATTLMHPIQQLNTIPSETNGFLLAAIELLGALIC